MGSIDMDKVIRMDDIKKPLCCQVNPIACSMMHLTPEGASDGEGNPCTGSTEHCTDHMLPYLSLARGSAEVCYLATLCKDCRQDYLHFVEKRSDVLRDKRGRR